MYTSVLLANKSPLHSLPHEQPIYFQYGTSWPLVSIRAVKEEAKLFEKKLCRKKNRLGSASSTRKEETEKKTLRRKAKMPSTISTQQGFLTRVAGKLSALPKETSAEELQEAEGSHASRGPRSLQVHTIQLHVNIS